MRAVTATRSLLRREETFSLGSGPFHRIWKPGTQFRNAIRKRVNQQPYKILNIKRFRSKVYITTGKKSSRSDKSSQSLQAPPMWHSLGQRLGRAAGAAAALLAPSAFPYTCSH